MNKVMAIADLMTILCDIVDSGKANITDEVVFIEEDETRHHYTSYFEHKIKSVMFKDNKVQLRNYDED